MVQTSAGPMAARYWRGEAPVRRGSAGLETWVRGTTAGGRAGFADELRPSDPGAGVQSLWCG